MSEQMITFDQGRARFNLRVVAVALDGDRVLLHRAEMDDFWTLPGGRGELLEPAEETLRREMREELGVDVEVGRLVWVMESFFQHLGFFYHELGLYFLVSLPEDSPLRRRSEPFVGYESDGTKLVFQWHELTRVGEMPLYPTFLRRALKAIPEETEYVVHSDG